MEQKKNKESRMEHRLFCRVSRTEKVRIKSAADASDCDMSAFVRKALMRSVAQVERKQYK